MTDRHLTIREISQAFDVTETTVANWRKGSTRITKLPCHTTDRGTRKGVYFLEEEVMAWALQNSISVVHRFKKVPTAAGNTGRTASKGRAGARAADSH